jgi:hypothetical protein
LLPSGEVARATIRGHKQTVKRNVSIKHIRILDALPVTAFIFIAIFNFTARRTFLAGLLS